jgi:hypothetical protein
MIIWCSSGLFLQRFPDPDPDPTSAHVPDTSPGPSTSRDAATGEERHLGSH